MKFKLLFLKDHEVKNGDGIKNDFHKEGDILEVESEASVEHFERRGVARLVDEKELKAMKAAADKAAADKAAADKDKGGK